MHWGFFNGGAEHKPRALCLRKSQDTKVPGAAHAILQALGMEGVRPEGKTESILPGFLLSTDQWPCILYFLNILIHINKLDALP